MSSDYDSGPGNGNTSMEYGSGGKKIDILPPDPGVKEGIGAEAAKGPFKAPIDGPSDLH